MPAGDVFLIVIGFGDSVSTKQISTTIHIRQNVAVAPDIGAIGDDVKEWWTTGYTSPVALAEKAYHKSIITLDYVTLRRVKPFEPVELLYTTGLPIAGTASGDSLPINTTPLLSTRTGNIGRSYRGRMFLPPLTEAVVGDDGLIPNADCLALRNQMQRLFDSLAVDRGTACVYSRKLATSQDITSILADRRMRTQKRRQQRTPQYAV